MDFKDFRIMELEEENSRMKDALARLGMLYIDRLEREAFEEDSCDCDECCRACEDEIGCDCDCECHSDGDGDGEANCNCCDDFCICEEEDDEENETLAEAVDDFTDEIRDLIRAIEHEISRREAGKKVVNFAKDSKEAVKLGAEAVALGFVNLANSEPVQNFKEKGKIIIAAIKEPVPSKKNKETGTPSKKIEVEVETEAPAPSSNTENPSEE